MVERKGQEIHIISTKLTPPRSLPVVTLERLFTELDASLLTKLIAIVAGAGFGKSTLAAEYLKSRNHPFVWYQVEETDRDPTVFLCYLLEALRRLAFDTTDTRESKGNAPRDLTEATHELLAILSEIKGLGKRDCFLVLDDFHQVDGVPEINEILEFILARFPPNFHLVLLSSQELNLDLARMRARRELMELGEEQLSFRPDETARLFSKIFSLPLKEEEAVALTALTEGWVSGLVFLCHALRDRGIAGLASQLRETKLPSAQIYDYLDRIVYQDLEPELKDFLLKTSLLSRLQPDLCDALLEEEVSRRHLPRLARNHLFTVSLDEKEACYRYHNLFRAFLRERLAETLTSRQLAKLHMRAASLWEGCGESEEAVRHYVEAGEYARAAELLESMIEERMNKSRISFIHGLLERVPGESMRRYPRLLYYRALTLDLMGRTGQALDFYLEAASLFARRGEVEAQIKCLAQALKLNVLSGKPAEAGELLENMLGMVERLPLDSNSWYELFALLGAGSIYLGLTKLAKLFIEQASAFMERTENQEVRAMLLTWCGFAYLILGNYRSAAELLQRASHAAEEKDLASYLPDIYCNLSITKSALGAATEALELAEKGLEVSSSLGGKDPSNLGIIKNLQARALALALLGERERAREDIQAACRAYGDTADRWEVINSRIFAGLIALDVGDIPEALENFCTAEILCRERKFFDDEMLCRLSRLAITAEERDREAVRRESKEAFRVLISRGAGVLYPVAHLLEACIEHKLGDIDIAHKRFSDAVSIDEQMGGIGWWKAYGRLALPLIVEKFERGEHLHFLARVLRLIGPDALPYLRSLRRSKNTRVRKLAREIVGELEKKDTAPLRIKILGTFEVSIGEESVPPERWKSKRALTILKYLAAHHAKGKVQREVLMELLWPDKDPASASRNLNMALTSLRKTLEPQATWGESRYLVSSNDSLWLNLGQGGWVDLELFEEKFEEARKAEATGEGASYLRHLLEAKSLYQGDFLAEDIYEDWCLPLREDMRRHYLDILQRLARIYYRDGEPVKAVHFLERAFQRDASNEEICRLLMELYAAIGDRSGVERTYARCKAYLIENCEITVSQETEEIYRQLHGV